jgi:AraC family transcriptional regulator
MHLVEPARKRFVTSEETSDLWADEDRATSVLALDILIRESVTVVAATEEMSTRKNVEIAFHNASVYEKDGITSANHLIALFRNNVARGESAVLPGHFRPFTFLPETMNMYSAGVMPACRSFTEMTMIVCGIQPHFMFEVGKETEAQSITDFRRVINLRDKSLEQILLLLAAEVESGGFGGRLYWDDLSHALALRAMRLTGDGGNTMASRHGMWSQRALRRVLERMESEVASDLSLSTLAAESGYSRSHFLRMFQAGMGCAPHQWLIRLRVERAKRMLRESSASIIDIAAACGFSSHAHLSRTFRKVIGVAPSQYRRGQASLRSTA